LSRTELAATICEHLGWMTASGGYKIDACMKLLVHRIENITSNTGKIESPYISTISYIIANNISHSCYCFLDI